MRFPATLTQEFVLGEIDKCGIPYEVVHAQKPLFNDKNSELIQTLLGVYNEVTGKNEKPIAIGGGTYARALKFGAAFGPEEEGEEQTIHQANEYITFEKIEKCFKIYQLAIERLTK
jgi:succinyl-diaminopimelate desuccinylase